MTMTMTFFFYVKMRLSGSGLSGNKARKLYALNKIPEESFPKLVASHGGLQVSPRFYPAGLTHFLSVFLLSKNFTLKFSNFLKPGRFTGIFTKQVKKYDVKQFE